MFRDHLQRRLPPLPLRNDKTQRQQLGHKPQDGTQHHRPLHKAPKAKHPHEPNQHNYRRRQQQHLPHPPPPLQRQSNRLRHHHRRI